MISGDLFTQSAQMELPLRNFERVRASSMNCANIYPSKTPKNYKNNMTWKV
jgi:hypothetical protein